ncbi:hypothetical protein SK128_026525, partial [Halocaridina rubra]
MTYKKDATSNSVRLQWFRGGVLHHSITGDVQLDLPLTPLLRRGSHSFPCSHRGSSGSVLDFSRGFAPHHGLRLARACTQ